jgi:hypothetical protein
MGAVKAAVMEVQDEVANCIESGMTLEETITHCSNVFHRESSSNTYLADKNYITQIYEDWRGGIL